MKLWMGLGVKTAIRPSSGSTFMVENHRIGVDIVADNGEHHGWLQFSHRRQDRKDDGARRRPSFEGTILNVARRARYEFSSANVWHQCYPSLEKK